MKINVHIIMLICLMLLSIGASYLLAKAGRPDNVWIWRDVLGVLK